MEAMVREYEDAELMQLREIEKYYLIQKERAKIRLATKQLNEDEKLSINKKISVYSLKIELIKYCIEKNEDKPK